MSRRRYSQPYIPENELLKLKTAFACFRKLGLIARQNFSCCGGCAGYELADKLGEKLTKLWETKGPVAAKREHDKVKGCVFYTRQDAGNMRDSGQVWLAYGPICSTQAGDVGMSDTEVGNLIIEVLKALDIRHEWNGSGNQRIMIDLRDPVDVALAAERKALWAELDRQHEMERQVAADDETLN